MVQRLFGTDGIRGRAGEGWLRPERLSVLARAVGQELAPQAARPSTPKALLAHDGRRSGPELARGLARGLRAAGYEVTSAELFTTPGLARMTRVGDFDLGIMISASHNPARDNGVKVFDRNGEKLSDATEDRIEARVASDPTPTPADQDAPIAHDDALEAAYEAELLSVVEGLDLDGLRIVIDCANGAGSHVAPRVLERLGAEVIRHACEPDGDNINRDCGSTHPDGLRERVRACEARLGIALDGDGDRCLLVDEQGALVHGDGMLTLLALEAHARGALPGNTIVATVMSNRGLHRALRPAGISVHTVGVGDRRVVEALKEHGYALGGEQSGHIVFGPDNAFIGDGTYTALRSLAAMRAADRPLSALTAPFQEFPQVLVNVIVAEKPKLSSLPSVAARVREIETQLGDDGRVLLRYSGTEPLARVLVEGPEVGVIRAWADELAGLIAGEIGAERA